MFIRAGKNLGSESRPESGFSSQQKHGSGLNFNESRSKSSKNQLHTQPKRLAFQLKSYIFLTALKKESSNVHLALGRITEYILVP